MSDGIRPSGAMNALLRALYEPVWQAALDELPRDRGLSAPLFVDASAAFASAPRRLLIVGKQTQLWPPRSSFAACARPDALDQLLDAYRSFAFGSDRPGAPFWSAAHQVRAAVDPLSDRRAMVWSNVIKIDENGDQPSSRFEIWIARFSLLHREVEVLQPDVAVFFTGPHFDDRLRRVFPGLELQELSPYLARLRHASLPRDSFRSYHPNWLRRSRNWATIDRICELLDG